jgi:hypothetical protein
MTGNRFIQTEVRSLFLGYSAVVPTKLDSVELHQTYLKPSLIPENSIVLNSIV